MVMPCSRSARRPSVSWAKSIAVATFPVAALVDGANVIFVDVLRVVEQAADQCGFAIIHAARGAEAHQVFGLLRGEKLLHGKHIFHFERAVERERHQK